MCREEKIISTSLQDIEIPEGTRRCSIRKFFKKFRKPHRKTPVLKPFLIKLQDLSLEFFSKGTPTQVLSCEIVKLIYNTYFEEHLQTTASTGV